VIPHDVIVIGAGHNGLVAASALARAGLRTLVLERADRVGGCAATSEIAPGFRGPVLAHRDGLDREVIRSLKLERYGLTIHRPAARACAPTLDGRALTLWDEETAAARQVAAFSARDAEQYPAFLRSVAAVTRVLRTVLAAPAPDIDKPSAIDLVGLVRGVRQFRALGRQEAHRLLRWLPMSVADFAGEWFESEPLRATVAAGGILGSFLGPRSAGSAFVLLLLAARDGQPVAPGWTALGGAGAIADALAAAARQAGAQIRTGSQVQRILADDRGVSGIVLASGEEIHGRYVVSSADPRRTLLGLVDPALLAPEFLRRVQNIRMRGALTKINYAVSEMPVFTGLRSQGPAERAAAISGCVRLARSTDAIERAFDAAKYGGYSDEPWIELAVPSAADGSLAPAGRHVVSAYVQFTPRTLRGTTWDDERERLADIVTATIDAYAPGFGRSIIARQVITPLDLERNWGLTGGHIFQGELALDQFFAARPLLGWSRYRTPLANLFLCGSGTHPGVGLDGRSGMLAAQAIIREASRRAPRS
jgi:phytoene dehydrogenase-like protein